MQVETTFSFHEDPKRSRGKGTGERGWGLLPEKGKSGGNPTRDEHERGTGSSRKLVMEGNKGGQLYLNNCNG